MLIFFILEKLLLIYSVLGKLFLLDPKLDDLSRARLLRIERVNVAEFSDELWKAVKGQSNLVLAGILRNICKYDI